LAHARGSRFRRSGSTRRQTSWDAGPFGSLSLTAAGSAIFTTGAQAVGDGLTLVRTRGELLLTISAISAAGDGWPRLAAGICIVSENAFGVGGAPSVPAPLTDIAWDGWLWHYVGSVIGQVSGNFGTDGSQTIRIPIDSKAMRRIKSTDIQIGVIELGTETGTATLLADLNTRILDKIP